ncbi:MAG: hypothetical protein KAW90_03890 [Dehalococcoidales bacterium]|nr:hypothetical protein [Dehalococcoidales bacterium]
MAETKYGDLVKKLPFREGMGGANARELVFIGGDELAGFEFNFIVGVYDQTGDWAPGMGAHTHPFDELLLFFGYDDKDPGYLGAELTIEIGQEHEKHTFDVPTAVALPKGTPHYPIVCNRVDKPYGVMKVGLGARYQSSWVE